VWQANSRIEQHSSATTDASAIALRLAPGVYQIRVQVFDKRFILGDQRFDRGTTCDTPTRTSNRLNSSRIENSFK